MTDFPPSPQDLTCDINSMRCEHCHLDDGQHPIGGLTPTGVIDTMADLTLYICDYCYRTWWIADHKAKRVGCAGGMRR